MKAMRVNKRENYNIIRKKYDIACLIMADTENA